jgi:hypothetical protein
MFPPASGPGCTGEIGGEHWAVGRPVRAIAMWVFGRLLVPSVPVQVPMRCRPIQVASLSSISSRPCLSRDYSAIVRSSLA